MKKYLYKSNRTFSIITAAFVVVIIAIFLVGIQASNTVAAGYPERISVASDGTQGNGSSADYPSISADGRYISFQSNVTNLVPGDTNDQPDIFVHDRQTGETERVSVASDGSQGNDRSGGQQAISADGRFVSFQSLASNLVPNDTNARDDVFVHDRQTGETKRVSVASDGTQGNSVSKGFQAISADGRYISFQSSASNITPGDTNANEDIFVHDRVTGVTGLVSVASDGSQGNRSSTHSSISADGRFVSFQSFSTNFVPGDTNQLDDVFVHDRETGTTERISVALDGSERSHGSVWPSISADGQFVTFFVQFSDRSDVFVHDRVTGVTGLVSVASDGSQGNNFSWFPAISGNGRFVVFRSEATNLVSGDTNGYPDVFVHDRQTHSTKRVSVASDGTQGNSGSEQPSISADGLFVLFVSAATNLVPGDTNGFSDVFVTQNSFLLPNSAPTANATGPYTVVEGGTVTLNGSGSDLDNDPLTYTWDLDNDGSFETPGQNPVFSAVGKDGQSTHSITLQVCDDEIACGTSTPIEVQITNAAPTPDPITASVNPLQVNTATTTSSSFTDPAGTLDAPYTVEWNWGDGNIDIETVGAPGTVVKEYTYTQAGVFEITLTITDKDGGVGTQPFQYLSVYSPTAQGLFSAGQKFTSPAGTYLQDPNATGNVMFGLSYKYQGELPAGNRQFTMDFKTANFEFNATTVSSLVIANGVGTLRGTGTITDLSGEYDFLVVGNEVTGSIRIQIKDSAGTIIYDTQPGASDTADPTTPVTGNMLAH